ncbi:hypothetical protein GCM10022233_75760 [Streptomyces shaanxiensis]|uniref:Ribosomal protein L7/L12 C-terminal domain-containing protein n=1 Tax=Streptomyces shaanxiensis TaxID=653357 RepID=A0ABP7W7L0_9ACTN
MIAQSGSYRDTCSNCGAETRCTATEALIDERLRWDVECFCPGCGEAWHEGGVGPSPAYVRNAIIAANGKSLLRISHAENVAAKIMKVMRDFEGVTISAAKRAADELRSEGRSGTLVELSRLANALRASGIAANVEKEG